MVDLGLDQGQTEEDPGALVVPERSAQETNGWGLPKEPEASLKEFLVTKTGMS